MTGEPTIDDHGRLRPHIVDELAPSAAEHGYTRAEVELWTREDLVRFNAARRALVDQALAEIQQRRAELLHTIDEASAELAWLDAVLAYTDEPEGST